MVTLVLFLFGVVCFLVYVISSSSQDDNAVRPSLQEAGPLAPVQSFLRGKEPPAFDGTETGRFKTWIFDIEEALSLRRLPPGKEVTFAASYLEGNAKLWFVAMCNEGKRPNNWFELRSMLSKAFGPANDDERSRILLLGSKQTGSLDDFIKEFSGLALAAQGVDEQTKAVLFMKGLHVSLQRTVLQQHPASLQEAIRAAKCAEDLAILDSSGPVSPGLAATGARKPLARLTPEEREKLFRERRCFRCRRAGHIARDCPGPNAHRQ